MSKRNVKGEAEGSPGAVKPGAGDAEDFVMERVGSLHDTARSFDIEYWQRQGDAAIFQAAWELAEVYHLDRGMTPDELRLQRTIEHVKRS